MEPIHIIIKRKLLIGISVVGFFSLILDLFYALNLLTIINTVSKPTQIAGLLVLGLVPLVMVFGFLTRFKI